MTMEQIKVSGIDALDARVGEIRGMLNDENADLSALEKEMDAIEARRAEIRQQVEARNALAARVAGGEGVTVRNFEQQRAEVGADSAVYRSAFFKTLLGRELNKEERAAYIHNTTNSAAVVPVQTLDTIWDLVGKSHAIMGDITIYRTGTVIEVVKHTAITEGAAAQVNEGAAATDEKNTFVKVTLSGKDFAKTIDVSYALERMSVDSLEKYLTTEIANGLGDAMANDIITKIKADTAAGNKVQSAAVGKLTFKEVAAAFGSLKRASGVTVYATRKTIFTHLVGMEDAQGRPIFQITAQEGANGVILGAAVKVEDAVAENEILIVDPKRVVYNMVQDIMIESDRDIKKHVTTYSGYARGEGTLVDTESAALLTVKSV